MSSPFTMFRRHQKVLMVVLTGLAMISFVVMGMVGSFSQELNGPTAVLVLALLLGSVGALAGISRGKGTEWGITSLLVGMILGLVVLFTNREPPAVYIDNGNLTNRDVMALYRQRDIANHFVQLAVIRTDESPLANYRLGQYLFGFYNASEASEQDIVLGEILRREGKEMGIVVTDNTVNDFINQITKNQMTPDLFTDIRRRIQVSEKEIYDALKGEMVARQAANLLLAVNDLGLLTPETKWELFQQLNVRLSAQVAGIPVADFVNEETQPTTDELSEFFAKYSSNVPGRTPEGQKEPGRPGFFQPRLIQLAYFEAVPEQFEAEVADVTDEDIQRYYEEQYVRELPELTPDVDSTSLDGPTLNPVDETESGTPTPESSETETPDAATPETPNPETSEGTSPPVSEETTPEESAASESNSPATEEAVPDAPESEEGSSPATENEPATEQPAAEATPSESSKPEQGSDEMAAPPTENESSSLLPATRSRSTDLVAFYQDADAPQDDATEGEAPPNDTESSNAENSDTEGAPAENGEESTATGDAPPTEANSQESPANASETSTEPPAEETPPANTEENADPNAPAQPAPDAPDSVGDVPPAPDDAEAPAAPADDATAPAGQPPAAPSYEVPVLDDALKDEIRQTLIRNRANVIAEARIRKAYDYLVDVAHNVDVDPSEEDHISLDQAHEQLKKYAAENNLEYSEGTLHSLQEMQTDSDFPLGQAINTTGQTEFVYQNAFSAPPSQFHPVNRAIGLQVLSSKFAYWKVADVLPFQPATYDQSERIKNLVTKAWHQMQARPLAEKRATAVAETARGAEQPMTEALAEETITGEEGGLFLSVKETGDFTWMQRSSAPSTSMSSQTNVRPATVPGVENPGEDFYVTVFEKLKPGDVAVVPNQDRTVYYVVKIQERFPSTPEELEQLRKRFLAAGPAQPYVQLADRKLQEMGGRVDPAQRLFEKYGVQIGNGVVVNP